MEVAAIRSSNRYSQSKLWSDSILRFEDGLGLDILSESHFDLMWLLSCIGEASPLFRRCPPEPVEVDLNTFLGKYLLFVCIYLPPGFNEDVDIEALYPRDLISTCYDLYSYRDDFEVILVTKMDDSNCDDEDLFWHSMLPFPPSSLVVPFSDLLHRDSLCEHLLLLDPGFSCLFVNANKGILHCGQSHSISTLVDRMNKLLKESSFDALRSYENGRLVKTMWPVILDGPTIPFTMSDTCPIARIFKVLTPEYPAHINHLVSESKSSCSVEIGLSFDVEFLLSGGKSNLNYLVRNDGERVEVERAFINKYIMVCCFHVPVFYEDEDSRFIQYLISTFSELYARGESFEMVVVVKMNKLANHEVIFNHFLSGFPSWCLVIQFEDSQRRDFICKYLNLDDCYSIRCLLLDKDKDKDMKRNILHNGFPDYLDTYGADVFPFTIEKLQELKEDEEPEWETPSTYKLERLLGCDPSAVLEKINAEDDRDVVTVSELNKKDVGLYSCIRGDLLPVLEKVYEQCRIQQKPFEIVLVYVPFLEALDPKKYTVYVDNLLQKYKISVWRLPFNNSVSRKIWRLTRGSVNDQLIVFGANNAFVEPHGGKVMRNCGIDAYPFSREGLIQREVNKLEELTLELLLVYRSRDYVYRGDKRIPVASLRGKNVLVCINSHRDSEFSDNLNIWYEEIKQKNSAFEMVFVHAHDTIEVLADLSVSADMPWLVCPFNPEHSSSLEKTLFMKAGTRDALVEFGTDGRVCSLNTEHLLSTHGSKNFPFGCSNLRRDVIDNFHRLYDFMDDIRN